MSLPPITLDGAHLTVENVVAVARGRCKIKLAEEARRRMEESHAWVVRASHGDVHGPDGVALPVYGVNTGYGSLARVRIPPDQHRELSVNLLRSHAAGMGPALEPEVVRGMMLLRANALAKGASGCQVGVVDALLAMLEAGVTPEVPSRGSCGSSGDLAPLAHLGLVLFEIEPSGVASFQGKRLPGAEAMRQAGIPRVAPGAKDGLAVTNGAQLCTALGALLCHDAARLVDTAEVAAAMTWEAMRGVTRALDPRVHALRPYPGAMATAANIRSHLLGSTLVDSDPDRVQDAYSLRCAPQILGAVRDALTYTRNQIAIELNAATDNPLILCESSDPNKAYSAGLFHGEPVGMVLDHLKAALCELASIAERRIFRMTTGNLSGRLPPLLAHHSGTGLMVPHTAAASLVSENRSLAMPASVDSVPTCEDQEDVVAMSTTAARRATEVLHNAEAVVAIELLSAATALWWWRERAPAVLGVGTQAALKSVEEVLGGTPGVGVPADHVAALTKAVRQGRFARCEVVYG